MLELYNKNPSMSFAFAGAPTPEERKAQRTENTKRFRLYSYLMLQKFNPSTFQHVVYSPDSIYMLINRVYCENSQNLTGDILHCIQRAHPEDANWSALHAGIISLENDDAIAA